MSGESDSRKDSQSAKFERRPQIFVKLSFRNTLKGGGKEKRGMETKILKMGQAGSRGGCLKGGGGVTGTPLKL